tara:strand:+ start:623 stop:739 length:117 start_codon:yes stop_codon:yes gene_type:complete
LREFFILLSEYQILKFKLKTRFEEAKTYLKIKYDYERR